MSADPFALLAQWLADARSAGIVEPDAMMLATSTRDARPAARLVLLRGLDGRGLRFFTNYGSRKAEELTQNPYAALVFYWNVLQRQVRVEGAVSKLDAGESDAYFARRPRGHQISAWASRQSARISSREALEAQVREIEARFPGVVPRPDFWGGYLVTPARFEFWQGRPDRLHDRIEYVREVDAWRQERLSP